MEICIFIMEWFICKNRSCSTLKVVLSTVQFTHNVRFCVVCALVYLHIFLKLNTAMKLNIYLRKFSSIYSEVYYLLECLETKLKIYSFNILFNMDKKVHDINVGIIMKKNC